jgi:hypothetical protein
MGEIEYFFFKFERVVSSQVEVHGGFCKVSDKEKKIQLFMKYIIHKAYPTYYIYIYNHNTYPECQNCLLHVDCKHVN